MIRLGAAVLMALVASQCHSPLLNPPTGPGTAYPCGTRADLCPDRKSCCPLDYDCGDGVHGCPADQCCYGGSSMVGASQSQDGGKPARVQKTAP